MENSTPETIMEQPSNSVTLAIEPNAQKDISGANLSLELASSFVVDSNEMYKVAGAELKSVKARCNAMDEKRKKFTKPLDSLKKEWMDFFRPAIAALTAAENHYKRKMIAYTNEQERIRQIAQAEADRKARKEREALEAKAAKAEAANKPERAEVLREQAEYVQQPIYNAPVPKVSGVSQRSTWGFELTSKSELIKACASGKVPHQALEINTVFLNQQARALKKELDYPGIKVVEKKGLASK